MTELELVALFNKSCPSLPTVKIMKSASTRWHKTKKTLKEHPDIKFWEYIFKCVEESSFLSGKNGGWRCGFDWLMNDTNLTKVYEGNYANNPIMTPQEEANHYKNKRQGI